MLPEGMDSQLDERKRKRKRENEMIKMRLTIETVNVLRHENVMKLEC